MRHFKLIHDPRLTLTYLTSRSSLLPNTWIFFKLLKPKSLFSLDMFNGYRQVLKVKVDLWHFSHICSWCSPINISKHNFLRNHIANWAQIYNELARIFTNCFGHMTKMAATPIYGKKPFKNLLLPHQTADDLGTWYVAMGMLGLPSLLKWWSLGDRDLLYFKVKFASTCIYWEFFWKDDFLKTIEAKVIMFTWYV